MRTRTSDPGRLAPSAGPDGPRRRLFRGWGYALAAAVVLLLGFGLGAAIRSNNGPTAPPAPDASTTAPTDAGGDRLTVVAGEGGSSLAIDGVTQIGYPHTCEGAVAAAANFDSSAARLTWVTPNGDEFLEQIVDAPRDRIDYYRAGQSTLLDAGVTVTPHPEWGGFRLVSCDSYTATVMIWSCDVQSRESQVQRSCGTSSVVVAWVRGDWKLRSFEFTSGATPTVDPNPAFTSEPLPAAERRKALTSAGPEWQEYANAAG